MLAIGAVLIVLMLLFPPFLLTKPINGTGGCVMYTYGLAPRPAGSIPYGPTLLLPLLATEIAVVAFLMRHAIRTNVPNRKDIGFVFMIWLFLIAIVVISGIHMTQSRWHPQAAIWCPSDDD